MQFFFWQNCHSSKFNIYIYIEMLLEIQNNDATDLCITKKQKWFVANSSWEILVQTLLNPLKLVMRGFKYSKKEPSAAIIFFIIHNLSLPATNLFILSHLSSSCSSFWILVLVVIPIFNLTPLPLHSFNLSGSNLLWVTLAVIPSKWILLKIN